MSSSRMRSPASVKEVAVVNRQAYEEEEEPASIPTLIEEAYQQMRSSNVPPKWTDFEKSLSLSNLFQTEIYLKYEHL